MPFKVVSGVYVEGTVYLMGAVKGSGSFGMNFGRPVVTNEDFGVQLYESDTLFPNYFWEDLFVYVSIAGGYCEIVRDLH